MHTGRIGTPIHAIPISLFPYFQFFNVYQFIILVYPSGLHWRDVQLYDIATDKTIVSWSGEGAVNGNLDAVAMNDKLVIGSSFYDYIHFTIPVVALIYFHARYEALSASSSYSSYS